MGLAGIIEREVRAGGPMRFHRFMELALYHPELGYYRSRRDPFGKGGDYFTNAQLQPVFGRLVGQQFAQWRSAMGNPDDFRVIEPGAGRGETRDVALRSLPGVQWETVEHGERWPTGSLTGVVFCNEFFDALPVDLVQRSASGRRWFEWGVDLQGGGLSWCRLGPSRPRSGLPQIAPGRRIETCERQMEAMRRILAGLRRGWVVVIDYGYTRREVEAADLYPDGTLMAYTRHRATPDVLRDPGQRDISAHVNFSALRDVARDSGAEVVGLDTQQAFLLEVGQLDDFQAALAGPSDRRRQERRMQLKTLLVGLGETFRVLLIHKG